MLVPILIDNVVAPPTGLTIPDSSEDLAITSTSLEVLGRDIDMINLFPLNPSTVAGPRNLGNAMVRRLLTDRGSLTYAPDYGYNVVTLLNNGIDTADILAQSSVISSELEKDDRVLAAPTELTYNAQTSTLNITANVQSDDGPFRLIIGISALGLEDLKVEVQ